MIGEKGTTLSGGQKLRVSLARALYADRDLIILDDPLSALDAHVSKFIFEETFKGFLRNKTIILVTHMLHFAKDLDYIFLFNDGEIYEEGTYNYIKNVDLFQEMSLRLSSV